MRLILLAAMLLCWPSVGSAQVLVQAGDKLQWDQTAPTLKDAQGYQYELVIDATKPEETRFILSGVVCGEMATPKAGNYTCSAPLPALTVGPHTLTMAAILIKSGPSASLLINVSAADPRCVFPTGSAAISIFPTRLLLAGARAAVSFQIGSPNVAIQQISVLLRKGTDLPQSATSIHGTSVTDVGMLWFDQPTDPGLYTVQLRAVNSLGCARTVTTSYTLRVE